MSHQLNNILPFFHIFISLATLAILSLAALQATLLSIQNHLIRQKSQHRLMQYLPSIETMEKRLFQIIVCGFFTLSISLCSAFLFVDDLYTASRLHKIILSLLAWLFFAVLLVGRQRAGWRGPTAVRWTLIGVLCLIVAYFSSRLIFLNGNHEYFNI